MKSTQDMMEGVTTEMVNANGLRFEVDQCGDQSSRKLALCLHGFPEHAISWRFQMPMLADLGYKVWAPNLRGYGNSSVPPEREDYAIEHLLQDVAGLIDAADCDEVLLMAHDWGAIIAWWFAMKEIRPLDHLVICNVPHPGPTSRAVGWEQLKKSWYVFFFQIPGLPEWLFGRRPGQLGNLIRDGASTPANYPDDVVDLFSENASRSGGLTAMINYYRDYFRWNGGNKRMGQGGMPIIKVPTLMCWGEDDVALTRETTYGTEAWVEDFTIRYLPRISHWVQQDAPEEVNAMISAFLDKKPVPYMTWESRLVDEDPAVT